MIEVSTQSVSELSWLIENELFNKENTLSAAADDGCRVSWVWVTRIMVLSDPPRLPFPLMVQCMGRGIARMYMQAVHA